MKVESVRALVGNTPLVSIRLDAAPDARFWVKLEGQNPTGSIKDRACVYNLDGAVSSGALTPGRVILDASSGNMACALAYFGRLLGHEVTVVCGTKLTEDKAAFIRYFGAELIRHGDITFQGNRLCYEMANDEPDRYCFLDQLHNWSNPQAAYETLGPEILADLPDLTAVVGSLGSGGSMLGTCRYIKQHHPSTLTVAVEAAVGTKLPGTSGLDEGDYVTPFIAAGFEENLFDVRFKTEIDPAKAYTRVAADQGIFAGWQTGGVLYAAATVAEERGLAGDVVVISGDAGWKNMEKLAQPG
jgi:cysteine synthase